MPASCGPTDAVVIAALLAVFGALTLGAIPTLERVSPPEWCSDWEAAMLQLPPRWCPRGSHTAAAALGARVQLRSPVPMGLLGWHAFVSPPCAGVLHR